MSKASRMTLVAAVLFVVVTMALANPLPQEKPKGKGRFFGMNRRPGKYQGYSEEPYGYRPHYGGGGGGAGSASSASSSASAGSYSGGQGGHGGGAGAHSQSHSQSQSASLGLGHFGASVSNSQSSANSAAGAGVGAGYHHRPSLGGYYDY